MAESSSDAVSPYTRMVQELRAQPKDLYHVTCFVLSAEQFLSWNRRRVWVIFTHSNSGGGLESARFQIAMVKDAWIIKTRASYERVHVSQLLGAPSAQYADAFPKASGYRT